MNQLGPVLAAFISPVYTAQLSRSGLCPLYVCRVLYRIWSGKGGKGAEPGGNFTWFVWFQTKGLVVRVLEWWSNFLP